MMEKKSLLIWIVLLIMVPLIVSCAYSVKKSSSKFYPAEYKPYENPGTASISGQASVTLEKPFVTTQIKKMENHPDVGPGPLLEPFTIAKDKTQDELDVIYVKGCKVFIHPKTTYSKEWFEKMFVWKGDHKLPPYQGQLDSRYTKSVMADEMGKFKIEGLPAGEYFVFTVFSRKEKVLLFSKEARKPLWTIVKLSEGENKMTVLNTILRKEP